MSSLQNITLESILLSNDRRNISALRPFLPEDFCQQAARLAIDHARRVLITTGFYLPHFKGPETDGPPGALAIGQALRKLGAEVAFVSDAPTTTLLERMCTDMEVICFPMEGEEGSRAFAAEIISNRRPTLLVSVERCALTRNNRYLNMHGKDISAYTARIDYLFQPEIPSIGIGDGGNEIGMGNLNEIIASIAGMPQEPAVTRTSDLIISSVSNWGSYGLVAAISALSGKNLLHREEEENLMLDRLYTAGCYDGSLPTPTRGVDGFTPAENAAMLGRIRNWLTEHLQRND